MTNLRRNQCSSKLDAEKIPVPVTRSFLLSERFQRGYSIGNRARKFVAHTAVIPFAFCDACRAIETHDPSARSGMRLATGEGVETVHS